jgi:thiol-disulfide isomerase/thioredoxin
MKMTIRSASKSFAARALPVIFLLLAPIAAPLCARQAAQSSAPQSTPPAAPQPAPATAPSTAPQNPPSSAPQTPPASQTPPAATPKPATAPKPAPKPAPAAKPKPAPSSTAPAQPKTPAAQTAPKAPDPEAELQQAVESANNDSAALVKNLEDYLKKFPDAPRKPEIYRALVEASLQIRDSTRALDYAERLIAIDPTDAQVMLLAAGMLEQKGDPASLERATDYTSRVLDQIQRATPDQRSDQESAEDWETNRKHAQVTVLLMRGRLEMDSEKYDDAKKDFQAAYQILPNPAAAMHIGEIAEIQQHPDEAIRQYALAFVLPDQDDATVDRAVLRKKLGNLWRVQHGSDAGLGERLLQAYDEDATVAKPAATPAPNQGIKDPLQFVLSKPDGTAPFQMQSAKGKMVVLSFWATWCTPCRELEPQLTKLQQDYAGRTDIAFVAVNTDEDATRVQPYLQQVHVFGTVVFADGLNTALSVNGLPTLMILDNTGKIAFRAEGYDPDSSVAQLKAAIDKALASAATPNAATTPSAAPKATSP